ICRVPSLTALPQGCIFASRCAMVEPACTLAAPPLESAAPDHLVRCFRWQAVIQQPELATRTEALPTKPRIDQKKDLLLVRNLKVYFTQALGFLGLGKKRTAKVIDGVDLTVAPQQTLGIVGE